MSNTIVYVLGFIFTIIICVAYYIYNKENFSNAAHVGGGNTKKEMTAREAAMMHHNGAKPLAMFYKMKHCPYCIPVVSVWDRLKRSNSKYQFVEIDRNEDNILLTDVQTVPAIFKYDGAQLTKYSGDRTYQDLMKFLD